jgi:hypothetical protein
MIRPESPPCTVPWARGRCGRPGTYVSPTPVAWIYRCPKGHLFDVPKPEIQEPAYARNTDPSTAAAAAASMTELRLSRLQKKALRAVIAAGGEAINEEIVELSGEEWKDITPRMRPLANKGMVEEAGTRKASTNRQQTVWRVTELGRAWSLQHEPP